MQTSTPVTINRKGRKSGSLNLIDVANTSIRRLNNVIDMSPMFSTVDDELERSNRRNDADILKRVSNISSPRVSYNEKEITDHIQVCLKMHAENKISSKNAWNLKIIDFMRTLLHSKAVAKDTLQVGSTSLDVSAKIYGIRVDDIHSDGLKLASTMARANVQKQKETDEDGDNAEGDDDQNEGPQKKKRKKRMKLNTIAKDPTSLLADVQKLESVFFQSHTVRDTSGSEPLFTNKMPMDHNGCKFMLLTSEVAWASYDKINPIVQDQKTYPFKLSEVKLQICNQLPHFIIDEWNPDAENEMLVAESILHEELAYDDDGIPIPELDGSIHDLFANAGADNHGMSTDEEGEPCEHAAINTNKVAHIVNFNPEDNNDLHPNEYSYSGGVNIKGNRRITQVWAGPSHWKLKHIRRTISRFSGQPDKQTAAKSVRKSRAQPILIDFYSDEIPVITKKLFKTKRYHFFEDPIKITFPQVLFTSNKRCLMSKPIYIRTHCANQVDAVPSEVEPYNYENPNDSQYCSQVGIGDDDDIGNNDGDFNADEDGVPVGGNFEGDNLIDAPELIPKTYIQYALQAKRMDMKKLKKATWKCLVSKSPNEVINDEDMYSRKVFPTTFASVYKQLSGRITSKMKEELSCPLAFVAILHLANEQNLQFTAQEDLMDFNIEQVTKPT